MKAVALHELRRTLAGLPAKELAALCTALARYKKDNKEFLTYLLYESHDRNSFVQSIREEIDALFVNVSSDNLYYAKKSLRAILRQVNKYCRYMGDKSAAADLHLHFTRRLRGSGIAIRRSQQLLNIYEGELKKIGKLVDALHEDLQTDYRAELSDLAL